MGWHCLIRSSRFQVYVSIICDMYIHFKIAIYTKIFRLLTGSSCIDSIRVFRPEKLKQVIFRILTQSKYVLSTYNVKSIVPWRSLIIVRLFDCWALSWFYSLHLNNTQPLYFNCGLARSKISPPLFLCFLLQWTSDFCQLSYCNQGQSKAWCWIILKNCKIWWTKFFL